MPFLNPKRVNKGPASGEVSYSTSSRNGNRANGNHLDILGLRIGLFCEIVTKIFQERPMKIGTLLLASEMPVPIPG